MSGFNMDGYVDVAERIAAFAAKYPEGSLQSKLELIPAPAGWLCTGYAYRTADDERPGVGHAFEPIPGKTPYTKDSEAMNAETSAWGRAIVALGFETKKIASAQEVRARQGDNGVQRDPDPHGLQASRADAPFSAQIPEPVLDQLGSRAPAAAGDLAATDKQKAMLHRLVKKLGLSAEQVSNDIGDIETISKRAASATIERLINLEQNREAAAVGGGNESDIPFQRTFA